MFLSFDVDRDRQLRDFFIGQGRHADSTWYVREWSEPYDDGNRMWITSTTGHIQAAEAIVVILSPTTFRAKGVMKEVAIGRALGKRIIQIIPRAGGNPHPIPAAGRVVRWEWQAVKTAIAQTPRRGDGRSSF